MTPAQSTTSLLELMTRVFWMMLGPMVLGILTFTIIRTGSGWFTPADFAFLALLGALLLARWLEFRGGNPRTSTGEPATPAHLRQYVLIIVAVGFSVWIVANLIGNSSLTR